MPNAWLGIPTPRVTDSSSSSSSSFQNVTQGKRFPLINPKKTSKRGYRDSGEVYIQDFKMF